MWMRYGGWAAHLYSGSTRLCSIPGRQTAFGGSKELKVAELSSSGLPFGRSCALCKKLLEKETFKCETCGHTGPPAEFVAAPNAHHVTHECSKCESEDVFSSLEPEDPEPDKPLRAPGDSLYSSDDD
jgi:hypothetical protein